LAAIIIVSVFGLINFKEAAFLWKANILDFWLMIATFISTLIFGIEYGIVVGVGLSLIILIFRTSRPYVAELGKVPESDFYRNKNRFQEVILKKDVLVFRFDAQLFYANSSYFRDNLDEMASKKATTLKLIVLDSESINRIDSTGVEMLKERIKFYQKRGVVFYFAGVKGPVRDLLFRGGLLEIIDINHFFMRVNDAVEFYKTGDRAKQEKYSKYIHQSYE
jgi:SulP family sulfate permease